SATLSAAAFVLDSFMPSAPWLCTVPLDRWRAPSADETRNQRDEEYDEKDVEQDLRNAARRRRQASEAQSARDQRNNKEHCCPVQHGFLLSTDATFLRSDGPMAPASTREGNPTLGQRFLGAGLWQGTGTLPPSRPLPVSMMRFRTPHR